MQSIGTLLSNLSGSILGIIGIFGFFMGYFEEAYTKYMDKRRYKLDFSRLKRNREGILAKNFNSSIGEISQIAHTKNIVTNRSFNNISTAKVHDESVVTAYFASKHKI